MCNYVYVLIHIIYCGIYICVYNIYLYYIITHIHIIVHIIINYNLLIIYKIIINDYIYLRMYYNG